MTFAAMRESMPYLLMGLPDVVDRRIELIRRQNDARNRAMLEKLGAAYGMEDETPQEDSPHIEPNVP